MTGGNLALHKYFWALVKWAWEDGNAVMEEYDPKIDTDNRMILRSLEDGSESIINLIGIAEKYRTLGVL